MVNHDAGADPGLPFVDARATGSHYAAGLVSGNDRIGVGREAADRLLFSLGPAILVQVAAAHAGGFHLDHHFSLARGGIGKVHQLEFAATGEDHAFHVSSACS